MALCLMCKNDVTAGYVVCGECASRLRSNAMPHILDYYIARLAARIAFDNTVYPCPMCEIENCCLGKRKAADTSVTREFQTGCGPWQMNFLKQLETAS